MKLSEIKQKVSIGIIGQIEYRLHKDKSWTAIEFNSLSEMNAQIRILKFQNYKIDLIRYFEFELIKAENPKWSAKDKLGNLIVYLNDREKSERKSNKNFVD